MHQLLAAAIVTIRIYNYAAVPAAQLDAARATAERAFRDTGISLQWIDCRVPDAANGLACTEALGDNEFVLRLPASLDLSTRSAGSGPTVSRVEPLTGRQLPRAPSRDVALGTPQVDRASGRGSLTLGSALIDLDAHGGVLITIEPQRIAVVAAQAGVDPSTVLGRAMAHELGHMLLGTPAHASAGLMRALWSQGELRADRAADWRFSPAEVSAMRHGLAARIHAAN